MNHGPPNGPGKQMLELLRELDRIIAAHGLTQYRLTVELLADGFEDGSFGLPGVLTKLLESRITALRNEVMQALELRVRRDGGNAADPPSSENLRAYEIARLFRQCGVVLEETRRASAEQARSLPSLTPAILESATADLFRAYLDGFDCHGLEARAVVTRAIGRETSAVAAEMRGRLEKCRTELGRLLRAAKEMVPSEAAPCPEVTFCLWLHPRFDPNTVAQGWRLRHFGIWGLMGQAAVRRRIQKQLANALCNRLWALLNAYSALMRKWLRRNFCALELDLSAASQTYQAHLLRGLPSLGLEAKLVQVE